MPRLISAPAVIKAAGNKEKRIEEYFGQVNSGDSRISIARMVSEAGWEEPGQRPEFAEYTVVLKGRILLTSEDGEMVVSAGQAVLTAPGEWIRYSTPFDGGAEYIAVCLPAFSPLTVHRDE